MIAGIDIGGTKSAVSFARENNGELEFIFKKQINTEINNPGKMLEIYKKIIEENLLLCMEDKLESIGISCGGPLQEEKGLILSPPNLPLWDKVDVVKPFKDMFNVPVGLQNDANACVAAEWKFGAGKGCKNMIFMTFGTGLGAGLILNNKLYKGTNGNAGEIGHIRLNDDGPVGYGKEGSFEGFCSGGGIAKLGKNYAEIILKQGKTTGFCKSFEELDSITAKKIGVAADLGDETALLIFEEVGRRLGQGISILIDILNPEIIVIGSIFARKEILLRCSMEKVINKESLKQSKSVCNIVPAKLGEQIGDYAAITVGLDVLGKEYNGLFK